MTNESRSTRKESKGTEVFKSVGSTGYIRHLHLETGIVMDHDQYEATEESFQNLLNLIREIQYADGIQPTNDEINEVAGAIVVSWGTTESSARMVGRQRLPFGG